MCVHYFGKRNRTPPITVFFCNKQQYPLYGNLPQIRKQRVRGQCLKLNLNFLFKVVAGPPPPNVNTAPKCCHEMVKIEGEYPNCHFTINEGDAGYAARVRAT
jgi:hypothetical protein